MAGKKYDLRGYQQQVQERITAIETTFDSNILLISGGSFTLSTGIAAWLKPVVQTNWLVGAWALWILCLLLILYSHLVGLAAHKKVVKLIDDGVEDRDALIAAAQTKTIERINGTTFRAVGRGLRVIRRFRLPQRRESTCTVAGAAPAERGRAYRRST